jgi:hypothetical protein
MTRAQLEARFPWLGGDEEVSGADVVQALQDWYSELEENPEEAPYRKYALERVDEEGVLEVDPDATVSVSGGQRRLRSVLGLDQRRRRRRVSGG